MASIHREMKVAANAAQIWDAPRDIGAIHPRLVPGFVAHCRLEGEARIITFGNGMEVREAILDLDDSARRIAWFVAGGTDALQRFPAGLRRSDAGSRLGWIADLLPHAAAGAIAGIIEEGLRAMKKTLEASAAAQ